MTAAELRRIRADLGLTQAGFAAELGISAQHYRKLESEAAGFCRPISETLARLARALAKIQALEHIPPGA